jgi:hypothetical protein
MGSAPALRERLERGGNVEELAVFFENCGAALVPAAGFFVFAHKCAAKWMDAPIERYFPAQKGDGMCGASPALEAERIAHSRIGASRRGLAADRIIVWEPCSGAQSSSGAISPTCPMPMSPSARGLCPQHR